MIIDSHNVIRKLDEKSVLSFLLKNKKPLIVYGMGAAGKKALVVLSKFNITAAAVVDGSADKQGTVIDGWTVESIVDVDARYNEYILLVTMTNKNIFDAVVQDMYERKINGHILWLHNYIDFDDSLPLFAIGMNAQGKRLQNRERCFGYIDWNESGEKFFNGLPVLTLQNLQQNYEGVNIVICDKRNEQAIISTVNQSNLLCKYIFSYDSPIFGEFAPRKYRFYPRMLRQLLFPHTTCLNKIYWTFTDDESRYIFHDICKIFFLQKLELTADVFLQIFEETYKSKANYASCDYEFSFAAVTEKIVHYIHFMTILEEMMVHDLQNLSLRCDGDIVTLTMKGAIDCG